MKPNFALNLSHEGISLLHRAKAGWLNVGDVSLDATDLNQELGVLRKTASGLESGGVASKLVIPNSQVLYTEVNAPGPDTAARLAQIRDGLVGLTPYDVNDLVFDYRQIGKSVQVAVVARETLAEAEAFATEYKFNPVSFVAVPVNGEFEGEPFFGPTQHASTLLGAGETVEPDQEPMVVMGPAAARRTPPPISTPAISESAKPAPEPVAPPPVAEPAVKDEPVFRSKAKAKPVDVAAAKPVEPDAADDAAPVAFASRRSAPTIGAAERAVPAASKPALKAPPKIDKPKPAKPQNVGVTASALDIDDVPDMPAWRSVENGPSAHPVAPIEDYGDMPSAIPPASAAKAGRFAGLSGAAKFKGFGGRKKAVAASGKEAEAMTIFGARGKGARGTPRYMGLILTVLLLVALAIVALWASFFLDGEPETTGTIEQPSVETTVETTSLPEPETSPTISISPETDALTTSLGTSDANAPESTSETNPVESAIEQALLTPPSEDTALGLPTDPAALTESPEDNFDDVQVSRLLDQTQDLRDEPAPDQILEAPPTLAEAETRYAATGIWQRDPEEARPPSGVVDQLEDLYIASIDPQVISQDAIAIPFAAPDTRPLSLAPPNPLGTRFELDERGLVTASASGTLAPGGHLVFLGQPPFVPGVRPGTPPPEQFRRLGDATPETPPTETTTSTTGDGTVDVARAPDAASLVPLDTPQVETTESATEDVATAPEIVLTPEQLRLQEIRPRLRPETLQEENERSRLGGFSRSELALIRPTIRPPSVQEEAAVIAAAEAAAAAAAASTSGVLDGSIDNNATELAIAASRQPLGRPGNFAVTIAKIRASGEASPESDASNGGVQVAAAARVPSIPTRASVAKQATERNAINLSRVNLIGVYGTPSDRRALVRLKSGRYVKVEVGDRVDGGRVAAIGDDELRYVKSGRNITLKLPRG